MSTPLTPAQSCAESLLVMAYCQAIPVDDHEAFKKDAAELIQRLLSSEVAKVHGEYQNLAEKWRREIKESNKSVGAQAALTRTAREVEALAPNKESQP